MSMGILQLTYSQKMLFLIGQTPWQYLIPSPSVVWYHKLPSLIIHLLLWITIIKSQIQFKLVNAYKISLVFELSIRANSTHLD